MNGKENKTISFTFSYDPLWTEQVIFNKFKELIQSDTIYYKYKMYLRDIQKCKTFKSFIKQKHKIIHTRAIDSEQLPIFWQIGDEIYASYLKNKNKNDAIILRGYWSINVDPLSKSERITNFIFFDYECDKSVLET